MLHCRGGAYYAGHTEHLEERISAHQSGQIKGFTADRLPVSLVWCQEFPTRYEALAMERRFKLTFPSLRDRDGTFVREYGTTAYPETFVIDRQGRVAAKRRGPVDAAWLDETLPAIIREKA